MPLERVAVIGAGAWGTALAQAAALAGRQVTLVGRDPTVITEINEWHGNSVHLPCVTLLPAVTASAVVPDADFVILAVPAQASRDALHQHGAGMRSKPVVLTAKGLEHGSLKRQSEVLAEIVPSATPYVLSGPSFAADVAAGRPTAVTLAGDDAEQTSAIAAALAGPTFRLYAADDRLGVELAGALKNVYAVACGAVEGAGLGASARSALLARAFAELTRLVVRMGGSAHTLTGLAGLGDLTLSCTSTQSRNYRYGVSLGRGAHPGSELAEGVLTAPVAKALADELRIDAPLIDAVNLLLEGNTSIADIVAGLMSRPLKREEN
ncbi:NAD(P)H-dependent glycerol-3-phosphate dehydrogenase [Devosia sp.]|uniref:NAD(P)H-dependent glycerol-3-phosphate dehydrogenase n=1 Tax=Devosia sp. TaxID=1871048 RepID=UPI001ACED47B|nr:NAD(P)H-dependent glycerol-3-phosphate dehydrogenase [Devosia sp.]MBN9308042.1 NAD(P)-dependent glycerol-3-phosphate dehydrogenase [Devosia sp.]